MEETGETTYLPYGTNNLYHIFCYHEEYKLTKTNIHDGHKCGAGMGQGVKIRLTQEKKI